MFKRRVSLFLVSSLLLGSTVGCGTDQNQGQGQSQSQSLGQNQEQRQNQGQNLSQTLGALPYETPPSFKAWENGNKHNRGTQIQTHTGGERVYYQAQWVLSAERMLQKLGYFKQTPNSTYTDSTKVAVASFQKAQGISATGWMTNTTFQRLQMAYAKQTNPTTTPMKPTQPTAPAPTPTTETNVGNSDENRILALTNAERQRNGLAPLRANSALMHQARIKAQDMVSNNYFSHQSPTLGSPFDQLRTAGIVYSTAGENIAGNRSADSAFNSWMNSSGHRANILNGNFNQIGIGVVNGGPYGKMLVQMFIRQ